jgi:cytidine deaminase
MSNDRLLELAAKARKHAHAPYSKFRVGAALLAKSGKIFTGCNVENLSFGLTICAERVAIATAVGEGERDFVAIDVVIDSDEPAVPWGACRQVLAEFNATIEVITSTIRGFLPIARIAPASEKRPAGYAEQVNV